MSLSSLIARAQGAVQVRTARNIKLHALRTKLQAPLVSFTFDDFPRSALTAGGAMLREAGWAGTFFAAGQFCGETVDGLDYFNQDDLLRASEEGHEVACHTFGHLRLRGAQADDVRRDLGRNAVFIRQILPDQALTSFAYPYGDLDLGKKALVARHFPVCRGIWPGLNRGMMDFAQLKAVSLESRQPEAAEVDSWLDAAAQTNAWLIFFTHDVSDTPTPYGTSRKAFAEVLDKVARRGMRVLPMKNAAGVARFAQ